MDLDHYQRLAFQTAEYEEKGTGSKLALAYTALGLGGESGEALEHVKKAIRNDGQLTADRQAKLSKELGDVLWYAAALASEARLSLNDIAAENVAKLADRRLRGVIRSEGDNR